MKQKIAGGLLAVIMTVFLAVPALAAPEEFNGNRYIIDAIGLLTHQQASELEQEAERISETYECGVYLVTTEDFRAVSEESTIAEFAKSLYLSRDLGMGEERNGILLVLSMAERDFVQVAYGEFANMAFTDYGKERMADEFLDDFAADKWYDGCSDYISTSKKYLEKAQAGEPVDVGDNGWVMLLICIGGGLLTGLIVVGIFYFQMRTAREEKDASEYLGKLTLEQKSDRYLRTTVVSRTIRNDNGKGGTTVDRKGFSQNSGKF